MGEFNLMEKYIGKWGKYQAYLYGLLTLPFAISGIQVMSFTFTGGVPASRCFLPEIDNSTRGGPLYNGSLVNTGNFDRYYSKPTIQRGKTTYCHYCKTSLVASDQTQKCLKDDAKPCDNGHVYDTAQYHTTLAAKFGMVCEEGTWKRSLASSCFMAGFLVGAAAAGSLADRYGRRPVFLLLSLMGLLTYHLIILVPNYPMLCFFHVLNGAFCHGAYVTGFVIVMEYISGVAGTICGIWVQGCFAVGYVYVGLCALFIRDWKWLQFAVSIPAIFLLPYFWLVPESVRWLVVHGKQEQAKEQVMKAAAFNGMPIKAAELEYDLTRLAVNENATLLDLFRNKHMAKVTLIIFYSWFATSMTYYGLSLNTSDLPGDDYANYLLSGLIEFPGYIIAIPMMEKWGRKPTIVTFFGFGGIAIVISTFLPSRWSWLIVTLASIGKMGAAASFAVVYNYSAELFPTVARNVGIGFASSCARLASISAPQIYLLAHYVKPWVPFLFYGLFAVIAAGLDLFLPETLGRPLPETMEDGIKLAMGSELLRDGVMHGKVEPRQNGAISNGTTASEKSKGPAVVNHESVA